MFTMYWGSGPGLSWVPALYRKEEDGRNTAKEPKGGEGLGSTQALEAIGDAAARDLQDRERHPQASHKQATRLTKALDGS